MDVLNEEAAMFESPLVDSYPTSPLTVSLVTSNGTHNIELHLTSHAFLEILEVFQSWKMTKLAKCSVEFVYVVM